VSLPFVPERNFQYPVYEKIIDVSEEQRSATIKCAWNAEDKKINIAMLLVDMALRLREVKVLSQNRVKEKREMRLKYKP